MIDLDPEVYKEKKERLMELGRMLEIPVSVGEIGAEISSSEHWQETPDGLLIPIDEPVIKTKHMQPFGSWTRNMVNMLVSNFCGVNATDSATFGDDHINLKKQTGVLYGSTNYSVSFGFVTPLIALATDDTQGLLIGTGTGAESFEDYSFTQIDHGKAGGELYHYGFTNVHKTWNSGDRTWDFIFERFFRNYSGGSITINEVVLVAACYYDTIQVDDYIISRDKFPSGLVVADDDVARMIITFSTAAWPS